MSNDTTSQVLARGSRHLRGRRPDLAWSLCLLVLSMGAVVLHFARLGVPARTYDEPLYALSGWRYVHLDVWAPGTGGPLGAIADNFEHPPFVKYLFGVAQVFAGGESITATRAVSSLATLLTALALGLWLHRATGNRWIGLAAATCVCFLPTAGTSGLRLGRFGMLDPGAGLMFILAIWMLWAWWQQGQAASWRLALGFGLLTGLSAASKLNAPLAVVGPAVLILALDLRSRDLALLRRRAIQLGAAAAVTGATFIGSYLPLGDPMARIAHMLQFQERHSSGGHIVVVAGRTTAHQPWWANLWFAEQGLGLLLTMIIVAGVLAALVLHRRRITAFLAAALVVPAVFHLFVMRVTLPYYWVMWLPLVAGLSFLGWAALLTRVGRGGRRTLVSGGLLVVLLVPMVVSAIGQTKAVLTYERSGVDAIPQVMRAAKIPGPVLALGITEWAKHYTLADVGVDGTPTKPGSPGAVAVGNLGCGYRTDKVGTAFVVANLKKGSLKEVYRRAGIVLYQRTGTLTPPGYLDIVAITAVPCPS